MFLHAHHLLDVVVGSILGYCIVAAIVAYEARTGPIGHTTLLCFQCVTVTFLVVKSKLKKKQKKMEGKVA